MGKRRLSDAHATPRRQKVRLSVSMARKLGSGKVRAPTVAALLSVRLRTRLWRRKLSHLSGGVTPACQESAALKAPERQCDGHQCDSHQDQDQGFGNISVDPARQRHRRRAVAHVGSRFVRDSWSDWICDGRFVIGDDVVCRDNRVTHHGPRHRKDQRKTHQRRCAVKTADEATSQITPLGSHLPVDSPSRLS